MGRIKNTLEYIAEMFGKEPDLPQSAQAPSSKTAVFPIDDLRYTAGSQSQKHVFASVVRAKELAIHLRNKYGETWMQHINEIHGEDEEVRYELNQFVKLNIQLQNPVITMTTDNVPVVMNGYHTVCAYRNQGHDKIRVVFDMPHRKSSKELNLKSFSEIIVYLSRANPIILDKEYVYKNPSIS